ncbi:MAG: permease [Deltaproteobacteria bacterium CG11_big_fil_rev_8_21_14_0_20_49_13]|nr:MAG: permease [Deltaproteobacteria bacterium CG11_big_fil_rev_8_21_14_0_20_49_13]
MNSAIMVGTGFLAGVLGGFLGVGGAVLMIPVLVFFLGFSQKMAQGTTLAAMIPPIGLMAALMYWKAGNVDFKAAILLACGFFIGGWIGGTLVQEIPDGIIRKVFAIFLVIIAVKMWMK